MTLGEAKRIIKIIKDSPDRISIVYAILDMVEYAAPEPERKGNNQGKVKRTFGPRVCEYCGKVFSPTSGAQKYCQECRDLKSTAASLANM